MVQGLGSGSSKEVLPEGEVFARKVPSMPIADRI